MERPSGFQVMIPGNFQISGAPDYYADSQVQVGAEPLSFAPGFQFEFLQVINDGAQDLELSVDQAIGGTRTVIVRPGEAFEDYIRGRTLYLASSSGTTARLFLRA